jgi:hypothetical protein
MTTQTSLQTVFDGGRPIGFIIHRGVSGFESFDARERSVGIFETAHRAATALRQLAETPFPTATCREGLLREQEQARRHACCGVVSNVCCDVSAPRGTVFKPSAAPLPPPKPAIVCTS